MSISFIQRLQVTGQSPKFSAFLADHALTPEAFRQPCHRTDSEGPTETPEALKTKQGIDNMIQGYFPNRILPDTITYDTVHGAIIMSWVSSALNLSSLAKLLSKRYEDLIFVATESNEDCDLASQYSLETWKAGKVLQAYDYIGDMEVTEESPYFKLLGRPATGILIKYQVMSFRPAVKPLSPDSYFTVAFFPAYGDGPSIVSCFDDMHIDPSNPKDFYWINVSSHAGYFSCKRTFLTFPHFVMNPDDPTEIFIPRKV